MAGTLNFADLAVKLPARPEWDAGLARAASAVARGVRREGRRLPLGFWLPETYGVAPGPVAALFAIMTKVGIYAIIRVTTLIYGVDAGAVMELTLPWLLPLALMTLALATLGALGAERLATMTAYLMIASIGTILTAVSIGGVAALSAALYYLAHSTLVIALLFLLTDLFGRSRDDMGDRLHPGPQIRRAALFGLAFLFGGATVAGVPPSTGFLGKTHGAAKRERCDGRRTDMDGHCGDECAHAGRLRASRQHRALECDRTPAAGAGAQSARRRTDGPSGACRLQPAPDPVRGAGQALSR